METDIFTLTELCEYIKLSKSSIRKLIKNKNIPSFKVLNKYFFNKKDIDKWLKDIQNKASQL